MTPEGFLDVALVIGLTVTGFRALHSAVLFTSIVFYATFGLMMSLVWVRLHAPDLALAEAAIGAGLMGALLIDSARDLEVRPKPRFASGPIASLVIAAFVALFASGLGLVFASLADGRGQSAGTVEANLSRSGVENPVTAVLLNFRADDTMLEVGILLVSAVGILVVGITTPEGAIRPRLPTSSPIAVGAVRVVTPIGVVIAGYLLWAGSDGPGGAFQAGSVLGALGVMLCLIGKSPVVTASAIWPRLILVSGFVVFLLVGLAGSLTTGTFLRFPEDSAGAVILFVEGAVTISIAGTLILIFSGGRLPAREESRPPT